MRRVSRPLLIVHAIAVLMLLAVAVVALAGSATQAGSEEEPPGIPDSGTSLLGDDDGDAALFRLADLRGGERHVRCIAVTSRADGPAHLAMSAGTEGDLGPYLHLTVDAGTGGRFDDCRGFSGHRIFDGTLAQFAASHAGVDAGLPVGDAEPGAPVTFRLSLEAIDVPEAQSRTASASFAWHSTGESAEAADPPDLPGTGTRPATPTPAPTPAATPTVTRAFPSTTPVPRRPVDPPLIVRSSPEAVSAPGAPGTPATPAPPAAAAQPLASTGGLGGGKGARKGAGAGARSRTAARLRAAERRAHERRAADRPQRPVRDLADRFRARTAPTTPRRDGSTPKDRAERAPTAGPSPIEQTFRRLVDLAAPAVTYPAVPPVLLLLIASVGFLVLRRSRRERED